MEEEDVPEVGATHVHATLGRAVLKAHSKELHSGGCASHKNVLDALLEDVGVGSNEAHGHDQLIELVDLSVGF